MSGSIEIGRRLLLSGTRFLRTGAGRIAASRAAAGTTAASVGGRAGDGLPGGWLLIGCAGIVRYRRAVGWRHGRLPPLLSARRLPVRARTLVRLVEERGIPGSWIRWAHRVRQRVPDPGAAVVILILEVRGQRVQIRAQGFDVLHQVLEPGQIPIRFRHIRFGEHPARFVIAPAFALMSEVGFQFRHHPGGFGGAGAQFRCGTPQLLRIDV